MRLSLMALACWLLASAVGEVRADISEDDGVEGEVIDEEPNSTMDFSRAVPQKDGSVCITKTKYLEKMEKQPVKECWHQNVTQCHDTYMTEFKPIQERVCEENFWKACKITFKEVGYNYTLKTCMTPLVQDCTPNYGGYGPPGGGGGAGPKTVCKTWYESQCNTTYTDVAQAGVLDAKPSTWCEKIPRKICAPDYCKMVPGNEECHDKTISSTVVRPEEVCDLQPSTQCHLATNLVPHLVPRQVCKDIPKEVCHLKLDNPKMVRKPVTMRWCTRPKNQAPPQSSYGGSLPNYGNGGNLPTYGQDNNLPQYQQQPGPVPVYVQQQSAPQSQFSQKSFQQQNPLPAPPPPPPQVASNPGGAITTVSAPHLRNQRHSPNHHPVPSQQQQQQLPHQPEIRRRGGWSPKLLH